MTTPIDEVRMPGAAVLAIDVGNSKTEVALVAGDGAVLGAARGPSASHQVVPLERAFERLTSIVAAAARNGGLDPAYLPLARIASYCAAGVDLASDERHLTAALERTGLAESCLVLNDCFAGLRAGTNRTWGVAVISGSGMNCAGISPNGKVARFDAMGDLFGDWGGGGSIGMEGIGAAIRAQDGRGPKTILSRTVPDYFGVATPRAVSMGMYRGRIPESRHREVAPLVFAAAVAGDPVARRIIDRLADEIVAWATAAIRRLRMQRLDPDVVLAGGMFRNDDPVFFARIEAGIAAVAPKACVVRLTAPPLVGSALLGLDRLHGGKTPPEVEQRLRGALTHELLARAQIQS